MTRASTKSILRLAKLPKNCDYTPVQVFGPYPPCSGRSRWRVQVYCPQTKSKRSVTFPTREEAELFIPQLRDELARKSPMSCHAAIRLYIAYKETYVVPISARTTGDRLLTFLPDVPLTQITEAKAQQLYLAETQRTARLGKIKAATHHARLRTAREFFTRTWQRPAITKSAKARQRRTMGYILTKRRPAADQGGSTDEEPERYEGWDSRTRAVARTPGADNSTDKS